MIRSQPQKCLGPAAVFDSAFLHDVAQGTLFLENLPPRFGREPVQKDLDRSEFNGLIGAVEQQHHFPEVPVSSASSAQEPQVDVATVKFLQRGRHIVMVHQQLFVGLGHGLAVHLLQRRQGQTHLRVKIVQRMRQRNLVRHVPQGGVCRGGTHVASR